jgi:uncharacterized protein GlcG (DUF336 family)
VKKLLHSFLSGFTLLFLPSAFPQIIRMSASDVTNVIAQAVTRAAQISPTGVVAVVDREGFVLGVWSVNGAAPDPGCVANAIAKAGTASFLSSDQHAFTSRTAGFIVQQNFPPGVQNKPPGPLVGVNFSNLSFTDVNRYKNPSGFSTNVYGGGGTNGGPVPLPLPGGLAGSPGGVPLFKNGHLIGGVGVAGDGDGPFDITPQTIANPDVDEDVALAGQIGYAPPPVLQGSHVTIDGIRVEYVRSTTSLGSVAPLGMIGSVVPPFLVTNTPGPIAYPTNAFGGQVCEIRQPIINDPSAVALGVARLNTNEVMQILDLASRRARTTRAGIRLPRGRAMQVFITVVNNPAMDGVTPTVLGTIRTPDATLFSWDVAVQKARTAVFFSNNARAYSSRTVGFLAQGMYPPGIAGTSQGIFCGLQERFSIVTPTSFLFTNPLNGCVFSTSTSVNSNLQNGITIFPGGFPLYRNGVLIGAIGVSGDGIDQDDIVGASGSEPFLAPEGIRADHFAYRGARLPFAKFPRNPAL